MGGMLGKTMEDNFKKQQEFMLEMNRCIRMLLTILWINIKSLDPGSPLRDRSRCRTRWGRGWWRARQVCKLTKTPRNSNWWNLKTPIFFQISDEVFTLKTPGGGGAGDVPLARQFLRHCGVRDACGLRKVRSLHTQQYNSQLVSKKTSFL